ncbi:distal tail protein Dit [Enterococcus faecium]|uniref:distal tail protein Dit n=1 Tax=Enterococcus faecium TaxID=1352 RepID=UPI002542A2A2|nr:distal tail protein Dit [Enterococcus faecium]MDK4343880.1 phage tail family protein [Enterococcus faecium]
MTKNINRQAILLCAFSYDGIKLEDKFDFYRTIKVNGRSSATIEFETDQVQIGSKIATQKLLANTIEIEFLIYYESIEDVQKQQRNLKQFLYREEDVPIIFDDDPQTIYYGRLSKFEEDGSRSYKNYYMGTYEIYCQNPLKYSKVKQSGNQITVNSAIETTPEKIEVVLSRGSSIKIQNKTTGKSIKITGASIYSGNILLFDFDQGILFVNGVDKTSILDLESDFENFYIHRGDVLECDNGKMVVYCREVYL